MLITGASSGIGEALAREYARRGARLVLAARRVDRLELLRAELAAAGTEALAVACDVCIDGDPERAVAVARERFGGLDIAIANAGFGVIGRFADLSLDDYRRQFETNVFGVLRTARAALADLTASKGRLAVMGSVMGHVPMPGASPYGMSKFAVRAFCESLRDELEPAGVCVTLLSPGFVQSEIRRTDNHGVLRAEAADDAPAWLQLSADRAARIMVRAIARGARERVITGHGRSAVWLYRHAPWLIRAGMRLAGIERKKRGAHP